MKCSHENFIPRSTSLQSCWKNGSAPNSNLLSVLFSLFFECISSNLDEWNNIIQVLNMEDLKGMLSNLHFHETAPMPARFFYYQPHTLQGQAFPGASCKFPPSWNVTGGLLQRTHESHP